MFFDALDFKKKPFIIGKNSFCLADNDVILSVITLCFDLILCEFCNII